MHLTSKKIQNLKSDAHSLKPVVMIGEKGLTSNILSEIDIALDAHELIKIKISGTDKASRKVIADKISISKKCTLVQIIGNILVLHRPNKTKGSK